jgi:Family of unknown function (DUF6174)
MLAVGRQLINSSNDLGLTMHVSEIPKDSNSNSGHSPDAQAKHIPRLVVPLVIGAIIILIVLIFYALFSKAFWQSRELEQNQAKWESQRITHYRFSVDLPYSDASNGRTPLTVEVKDGIVVSVVDASGATISPNDKKDIAYSYSYALTISGLFSYANQTFWEKHPSINVTYDPNLGYPKTIYIIPYVEPCCQGLYFDVQEFQILP